MDASHVVKPLVKATVCASLGEVVKQVCVSEVERVTSSNLVHDPKVNRRRAMATATDTGEEQGSYIPWYPKERLDLPEGMVCTSENLKEYAKVSHKGVLSTLEGLTDCVLTETARHFTRWGIARRALKKAAELHRPVRWRNASRKSRRLAILVP